MSGILSESWRRLKAQAGMGGSADEEGHESPSDIASVLGALSLKDFSTLRDVASGGLTHSEIDDKTYLMERVIQLVTELPTTSVTSQTLTQSFLTQLWDDLEHPPKSYLGHEYTFRKADGSNNNFLWPHIGAAYQPYARSIKPVHRRPIARPDPGVVFDSILKRKSFRPHPNKISSVLFYVASIIIHDIFHTSHEDVNISETSSYLDLAPLYGNSVDEQMTVRTGKDGKLKPDCFADKRILGFPPGVGCLLIFFNRFHNQVVDKLAQIDENRRFSIVFNPPGKPKPDPAKAAIEYDEVLFQTARLITTGLYINIIMKDYVRTILNLNRTDSNWNLDPRSPEGKALFGKKIPEATGNQVSAEFNLVYRWHSCVSEADEQWTKDTMAKAFKISNPNPTMGQFLGALNEWASQVPKDPQARPFADLKRQEDGSLPDDGLADIWIHSVKDVAGAYGANHVPSILRNVEILGIMQARSWNLASLNEFRKYFKLKPHETFEEINPDPEVADQLRHLYEHPDNVEIYPGIVAEAAKAPKTPGSGLCTTFTTSRAILSDAVALVRGDRFYTVDYTTATLTNYGYSLADYDSIVDNGCVFYKLVLAALPNNFSKNSVYVHYPLVIPSENEKILSGLKKDTFYEFKLPQRQSVPTLVSSFAACQAILASGANAKALPDVPLPITLKLEKSKSKAEIDALATLRNYLTTTPTATDVKKFYEDITNKLLKSKSYLLAGVKQVDIVRDVMNLAQVHFVACMFALPLKTEKNPTGTYTAEELWATLIAIYSSIHPRAGAADSFKAQQIARPVVEAIGKRIEENIDSVDPQKHGIISSLLGMVHEQKSGDLTDHSIHLISSMLKQGVTSKQLAYHYILPMAASIAVAQARAFADCLDYFLGADKQLLATVSQLATSGGDAADAQLEQYALEALRLNSKLKVYAHVPSEISVQDGEQKISIAAEGVARCDLAVANMDPKAFTDPEKFTLRKPTAYLPGLPGFPPAYPGISLGRPALVGTLKAVARLQGLQRVTGPQGTMKKIRGSDGTEVYLASDHRSAHTYPSSMKVNFS